jgi:hypothetical protein
MGPGRPWTNESFSDEERAAEPRTFQYIPAVNSTISPRLAYNLMAFTDLDNYALNVPECALCIRLPTEELKSFIPTLVDKNDQPVDLPEMSWMTKKPDRYTPWPSWLSRLVFNILAYDAPALYRIRDVSGTSQRMMKGKIYKPTELTNLWENETCIPQVRWHCTKCGQANVFHYDLVAKGLRDDHICFACGERMTRHQQVEIDGDAIQQDRHLNKNLAKLAKAPVMGLRIIDGTTIFAVIDERGEQPQPPAPAFTQVIWGVPRMYLNTRGLLYQPRFLRPKAPYGRTFIEDSLSSVVLLSNLWDYEGKKYTTGTMPEMAMACPPEWTDPEKILQYENDYNDRMAGNSEERASRVRFFPNGMTNIATKDMTFNSETYQTASNAVRIQAGIPKSEVGEAPEGMLGGKGFAEAMSSVFYRMCISPLQAYIESLFNDTLTENGYDNVYFKLMFPKESMDPDKEEAKFSNRLQIGGITLDEYRGGINMKPIGGELGKQMAPLGGKGGGADDGSGGDGDGSGDKIPVKPGGGGSNPIRVSDGKTVQVLNHMVSVLRQPLRVKKALDDGAAVPQDDDRADAGPEDADGGLSGVAASDQEGVEDDMLDLGEQLGVDWDKITMFEWFAGLKEEQEHAGTLGGDQVKIAQVALDHLNEDPHYYDKLEEAGLAEKFLTSLDMYKTCGVDALDEQYYGAPVAHPVDVPMPHQGANDANIVSIGGVNQEVRPAVWKPLEGEKKDLQDWVGGEMYRRSEAVYLLDRELAPDVNHYLVPVTWMEELDGKPGSIQHYVQGREKRQDVNSYDRSWVQQAAVLDYISGQVDRNQKNWLTHPEDDGRPVLIDSDLSFPVKPDQELHSSFIDAMRGQALDPALIDSVYLIIGNHDLWTDIRNCLEDEDAVANALQRAVDVYKARCIPMVAPHPEPMTAAGGEE